MQPKRPLHSKCKHKNANRYGLVHAHCTCVRHLASYINYSAVLHSQTIYVCEQGINQAQILAGSHAIIICHTLTAHINGQILSRWLRHASRASAQGSAEKHLISSSLIVG